MTWETTAADVYKSFGGSGWIGVALLALTTAFLSVGLAYMLAIGFHLPTLRRWAKAEFYQAAASAMLVALVFTFVQGEDILSGQPAYYSAGIYLLQNNTELLAGDIVAPGTGGKVKPFTVAYAHVRNMIDCAEMMYRRTVSDVMAMEWLTQLSISFSALGFDVVIPFNILLYFIYQTTVNAHAMANSLIWLIMALYFQLSFLQWVETSMLTVFFPLGIILRILPITRGAGAVLIALSLGLYIVYPLLFIIIAANVVPPEGCAKTRIEVEPPTQQCLRDPSAFISLLSKSGEGMSEIDIGRQGGEIARLSMYAFFYPIVMILIVLVFVRTAASFLGADITEVGRGLFRLV